MEYIRLKDAIKIKKGKKVQQAKANESNTIRYIQIDDLRNDNEIKYCYQDESYIYVDPQDIIIAWDGANAGTIGYGLEGVLGSTLAKLTLTNNKLYAPYVALFLQSKFKYFQNTATGATIPHISRKALEDLKIPVFELLIQKKIYNVLSKIKTFSEKRQSQILALDELTQSVFLEMFGDPKVNKNGYSIESLTNFYENPKDAVKCGPFGSALKKDEYVNEGIPVWNMDNITKQNEFIDCPTLFVTPEKAESLRSYDVKNGDIIISRAGTVGKMAVIDSEYESSLISTNLIRLRLSEKLKPEFLVWLIKIFGDKVCRMRTGNDGSFTHMNTSVLNSIEFPYPPLAKQEEFLKKLKTLKKEKEKLLESFNEMNILYNALLQKAFKGELFQEKLNQCIS
ncbi:restriction endonuclease subunit S [Bacillus inaquosorum]|uniref:restriction endonuclease subunit S n=1 Tax=Bacillus inaquosorum TaxID=483913 RepID=UPI002282C15D|nr:restriction endonuclease subunit S [Bacillus inaquosorum]MCY9031039.1 restriction endonuclease subunit S [Bacillus inaquosorum]